MKRNIALILLLVMTMLIAVPPVPTKAQSFVYTTGIQVVNLENVDSVITLEYVGSPRVTVSETLPASGSRTYLPIHADPGFTGSVVVSSQTRIAAIANLTATNIGYASYVGGSTGATTVNLPLLMAGNKDLYSWFSVQNLGTTADINVAYSDGTSITQLAVPQNGSHIFDQRREAHNATVLSAIVTSSQPMLAVVVQEGTIRRTVSANNGFTADNAAPNIFMPLINANNKAFSTGMQIQNTSGTDTNVTVSYTPVSGQAACKETRLIPAHASTNFAVQAFAGLAPTFSDCKKELFVGSAQVTYNSANVPLVATVNQSSPTAISSYGSFNPAQATESVVMPLIMDRNNGWGTGFTLVNVGAGTVDVTCTFTTTSYIATAQLVPGAVMWDMQTWKIRDRYVGSGFCNATPIDSNPARIVAVVNQSKGGTMDLLLTYEAINVTNP